MKILIIHTHYQQKGGEDSVFEQESSLLSEHNEVECLVFSNEKNPKGLLFIRSIWNNAAAATVEKKIKEFKPDIVHIHNWHFATGPIIFRTIKKLNVTLIVTLHNYRLLCPSAILLHNNENYNKSLNQSFPWCAVKDKVYRNSFFQTFWLALINWTHKKINTWNKVDKYIVLTPFAKNIILESSININGNKLIVKPNFVREKSKKAENNVRQKSFLFIGRLSAEKGIESMINAFIRNNDILNIGGTGPLKEYILEISKNNSNIKYRGELETEDVHTYMTNNEALIFPSIWYEGMPMTIIESFSSGLPVIASSIGAMTNMIIDGYNGLLYKVGDSLDLERKIIYWNSLSNEKKQRMSVNAYNTYLEHYTPEENNKKLMNIYKEAIKESKK